MPPKLTVNKLACLACVAMMLLSTNVAGEEGRSESASYDPQGPRAFHTEFQLARLRYRSTRERGWRPRWLTDYPEADLHLLRGVNRLTNIRAASESRLVSLMDDDLFDYPVLYAVEPGAWFFDADEALRLREYLQRGGSLFVDDFHGSYEWQGFVAGMRRVLPNRRIIDIPRGHPIFHTVFDLDEPVQIPGIAPVMRGMTHERDGYDPHWRAIADDDGRLMVVINHNMDLGDAWEHADVPWYALRYTNDAYKYAINYIVYAMTR